MRTWVLAICTAATSFGIAAAFGQTPGNNPIPEKYVPCTGDFEGNYSFSERQGICDAAIESNTFQGMDLAQFYLHRWAIRNAKKEKAQSDLDKALAIRPDIADDVIRFAQSYIDDKEFDLAKAALDAAAKAQPRNWSVHYHAAELALRQGAFDLAVQENAKALDSQPDGEDARHQQATVLAAKGDVDGAIAVIDKLIVSFPDSDVYYNLRCYFRAVANRDLDKALADCNTALKIKPNNQYDLDSRGLVYLRMGRYAEAIADYTAGIRVADRPSPNSLYGRALAERQSGDSMGAAADLQAAEVLSPGIDKKFNTLAILVE